jgi:hypothetical protein
MKTALFGLLIAALAAFPAYAQSRYSTWSNPDGGAGGADGGLVEELNTLIDEAEKARAADPVFLRDLRAAIARHSNAWTSEVLRDDFRDGDFTHDPAWTVESGKYWIEKGYGLRSAVTPEAASGGASGGRDVSKEELAAAVLGGLLNKALGGKTTTTQDTQGAAARTASAKIYAKAQVPNAFSLTAEITSWKKEGAFALGPYQGARSSGYKLVYHPGQRRSLELIRYSTRGASVVEAFDQPLDLEDSRAHVVQWNRTAQGEMTVKVDGKEVIRATDRSFRDAFSGIALENLGGDYVLARISVFGG